MKFATILFFILAGVDAQAQWQVQNIGISSRYDDVFFINDSIGFTSDGYYGRFYKTNNGGLNWEFNYQFDSYIRSIEFVTPLIGYCGSLDSALYKTIDGGNSWTDITNLISPKPPGICGLSAPSADVIYGCGKWSSPAFIIKSIDSGNTWTTYDLSSVANCLIDVCFLNKDTGFATGRSSIAAEGGIILMTIDGGLNWTTRYKTMVPNDYVWKIQSPDGLNYYASLDAQPNSNNVRILKSVDEGLNWNTIIVDTVYNYTQAVGFIDSLKGWTGGDHTLYETQNGGILWSKIILGSDYCRFFKVNDSTAFLTGSQIYKYQSGNLASISSLIPDKIGHKILLKTNPIQDLLICEIKISNRTECILDIYDNKGTKMISLFKGYKDEGTFNYTINFSNYSAQTYFVVLNTNEGMIYQKGVKK